MWSSAGRTTSSLALSSASASSCMSSCKRNSHILLIQTRMADVPRIYKTSLILARCGHPAVTTGRLPQHWLARHEWEFVCLSTFWQQCACKTTKGDKWSTETCGLLWGRRIKYIKTTRSPRNTSYNILKHTNYIKTTRYQPWNTRNSNLTINDYIKTTRNKPWSTRNNI